MSKLLLIFLTLYSSYAASSVTIQNVTALPALNVSTNTNVVLYAVSITPTVTNVWKMQLNSNNLAALTGINFSGGSGTNGNWVAEGSTNSTLAGIAKPWSVEATDSLSAGLNTDELGRIEIRLTNGLINVLTGTNDGSFLIHDGTNIMFALTSSGLGKLQNLDITNSLTVGLGGFTGSLNFNSTGSLHSANISFNTNEVFNQSTNLVKFSYDGNPVFFLGDGLTKNSTLYSTGQATGLTIRGSLTSAFIDPISVSTFGNRFLANPYETDGSVGYRLEYFLNHNTGNLIQILNGHSFTNAGTLEFAVASNSGYDGSGTHFLSDDGTFKTVSGGGGDTIWTNISGMISATSDVVDGGPAFILNTSNLLTSGNIVIVKNQNTNVFKLGFRGGISVGVNPFDNSDGFNGRTDYAIDNSGSIDLLIASTDSGQTNNQNTVVHATANTAPGFGNNADFQISAGEDEGHAAWYFIADAGFDTGNGWNASFFKFTGPYEGADTILWNPVSSSDNPYGFIYHWGTVTNITTGNIFEFANLTTNLISGNYAGHLLFGPGITNSLYVDSGSLIYSNSNASSTGPSLKLIDGPVNEASFTIKGVTATITGSNSVDLVESTLGRGVRLRASSFVPLTDSVITLGADTLKWQDIFLNRNIVWNGSTNSLFDTWGSGSPEGVKTARLGSIYRDTLNGVIYKKASGTGNTGWIDITGTSSGTYWQASGTDPTAIEPIGTTNVYIPFTLHTVGQITNNALTASTLVYSTANKVLGSITLGNSGEVFTSAGAGVAPSFNSNLKVTGTNVSIIGNLTANGGIFTNTLTLNGVTPALNTATISAGIGLTGGGDLSANRTITWAPYTWNLSTNTIGDSSQATYTENIGLSGATDPQWIYANNSVTLNVPLLFNGAVVPIQIGGTSASFPGLKNSGATLQARLANDGGLANFSAGLITASVGNNAIAITGTGGSITGSGTVAFETLTGTWNTTGVVDGALRIAITDTASGVASKAFAVYGGASASTLNYYIDKSGNYVVPAGAAAGFIGGTSTVMIYGDSANLRFRGGSTGAIFETTPVIQLGNPSATATAMSIVGQPGTGTDKVGGDTVIGGGLSTGTGTPGRVGVKYSSVGATSSALNTYTTTVFVGGSLKVDTTTTGNVGGGEDNLITYSIPAGQLSVNGQSIEFDCGGTFAATINSKTLKVYFGATVILNTTSLVLNNLPWKAHGKIIRTGAATQKCEVEFTVGGTLLSAINGTISNYTTAAETLSGAITFKCTGSDDGGVPANDAVVQEYMHLKWYPNGN